MRRVSTVTTDNQSPYPVHVDLKDGSTTELKVFRAVDDSGPVVILLPAMGVTSGYYEVFGEAFAEAGTTAVLVDLRGSGTSSVRASRRVSFGYAYLLEQELPLIVETVCRTLGVERVVLCGHSFGGQLGALYAATSDRVSHTALIASGSAWYRRVPGLRSVARFFGLLLIFATTLLYGYLPKWLPFAGRESRGVVRDWGYEAMTGRYRIAGSTVDYEKALAASRVPALFVLFPDDPYVPAPCMDHLAAKLVSADVTRHELTPDRLRMTKTHHFRWVLRPQAVVDLVLDWTRTTADRPKEEPDARH
jgi:predicted alpha/beta hydrolase